MRKNFFLIFFLFLTLNIFSQRQIKFQVELPKFSMYNPMETPTKKEIKDKSFEVAEKIIKGSLFGYRFIVQPKHKDRELDRYFFIELIDKPIYKKNIENYSTTETEFFSTLFFRYKLSGVEALLTERIIEKNNKIIFGYGEILKDETLFAYDEVVEKAIENSVVEYLKIVSKNKPKEMSGRIYFFSAPVIKYDAGFLKCNIKLYLEILSINDWETH